ncbi:hypothetical protein COI_0984 [Mannheimia haemolytica serotype A2 str. OVINE]|nr:hypothetical protein COI_0984 [Mannheimia haemolytica serotype A2 str. OVINE]EEY12485.1 hypothetical protein COK_1399 [Mannheimia haemolytica serotype A2 str. BOVINE]
MFVIRIINVVTTRAVIPSNTYIGYTNSYRFRMKIYRCCRPNDNWTGVINWRFNDRFVICNWIRLCISDGFIINYWLDWRIHNWVGINNRLSWRIYNGFIGNRCRFIYNWFVHSRSISGTNGCSPIMRCINFCNCNAINCCRNSSGCYTCIATWIIPRRITITAIRCIVARINRCIFIVTIITIRGGRIISCSTCKLI